MNIIETRSNYTVFEEVGKLLLFSYNSHVLTMHAGGQIEVHKHYDYSNTTKRHICKFLQKYHGKYNYFSDIKQAIEEYEVQVTPTKHGAGATI